MHSFDLCTRMLILDFNSILGEDSVETMSYSAWPSLLQSQISLAIGCS